MGEVFEKGKVNPAMVHLTEDKTAGHRWRSKNTDEQIVDFFEDVADHAAVFAKKAMGFAAIVAAEFAKTIFPASVISSVTGVMRGLGAALDAMGVDNELQDYADKVDEAVDFALSGLTRLGEFGLNGSTGTSQEFAGGLAASKGYAEGLVDNEVLIKDLQNSRKWEVEGAGRGFPKVYVETETTSFVTKAKLLKAYADRVEMGLDAITTSASIAMTVGGALASGQVKWESSAGEAWNDFPNEMASCIVSKKPSYL